LKTFYSGREKITVNAIDATGFIGSVPNFL